MVIYFASKHPFTNEILTHDAWDTEQNKTNEILMASFNYTIRHIQTPLNVHGHKRGVTIDILVLISLWAKCYYSFMSLEKCACYN